MQTRAKTLFCWKKETGIVQLAFNIILTLLYVKLTRDNIGIHNLSDQHQPNSILCSLSVEYYCIPGNFCGIKISCYWNSNGIL